MKGSGQLQPQPLGEVRQLGHRDESDLLLGQDAGREFGGVAGGRGLPDGGAAGVGGSPGGRLRRQPKSKRKRSPLCVTSSTATLRSSLSHKPARRSAAFSCARIQARERSTA